MEGITEGFLLSLQNYMLCCVCVRGDICISLRVFKNNKIHSSPNWNLLLLPFCACRTNLYCNAFQVTKNSCSLWKIFLICLLACLVATAITALAFYFGHFGNSTNTTIVVHTDGRSCQDPCVSPSTPSPTTTPSPGPGTSPSPDTTTPSLSSTPPTSTTVMPITTPEHVVEIDYD